MWQRFTERARATVFYAQEEALRRGEGYVSTEHLLLGLIREPDSLAALVLEKLGVVLDQVRDEIELKLPPNLDKPQGGEMELTPRAKRVIDMAYDEARHLNNNYIGTEHVLLGLVREGEGLAGRVLSKFGVDLDNTRTEVTSLQESNSETPLEGCTSAPQAASVKHRVHADDTGLRGMSVTSIAQFTPVQALEVINVALAMKYERIKGGELIKFKRPKVLAMIFEKPSLRTRVTFETGMFQMGGHAIFLGPQDIQMGKRETPCDIGANLSRWVDAIMARVFRHEMLIQMDEASSVPVINALSDLEHPCQALADLMTFYERVHAFEGRKLAWVGDSSNVCHSVMLLCALIGVNISIACPEGYGPNLAILTQAEAFAKQSGSIVEIVHDPVAAVKDADAIETDVWTSMGQESETKERKKAMQPFQVNKELLSKAKPDAIVLHCLPAHRDEEITGEVLDGKQAAVLDESENRLHAQKALLALLLGEA